MPSARRRRVARPSAWPASLMLLVALVAAACTSAGGASPSVNPTLAGPSAATATPILATAAATPAPTPAPTPVPTPAPTARPTAAAFPLTLTDDEGNTVVIPAAPQKIVSLTPATTELVFALGAGDRMVGGTDADDYPPEAKQLAHVATYSSVDVEKIVGLGADLVIAGGNGFNKPEALDQLRRLHVPVLVVYAPDVKGVLADIDLVGRAIGSAEAATAIADAMQAQFDQIAAVTANLDHPRVFYELDATKEIYGPADKSFIAEMIMLAGGTPITTGSTTVFSIPLETLIKADPQVIILGDSAYGTTAEIVASRPGWKTMTAVKNNAIRGIDDTVVSRPGPRLVEGVRDLALAIHPDLVLPPLPSASAGAPPSASPIPSPT
jgi:iron complex transport system substrate-binding protein